MHVRGNWFPLGDQAVMKKIASRPTARLRTAFSPSGSWRLGPGGESAACSTWLRQSAWACVRCAHPSRKGGARWSSGTYIGTRVIHFQFLKTTKITKSATLDSSFLAVSQTKFRDLCTWISLQNDLEKFTNFCECSDVWYENSKMFINVLKGKLCDIFRNIDYESCPNLQISTRIVRKTQSRVLPMLL